MTGWAALAARYVHGQDPRTPATYAAEMAAAYAPAGEEPAFARELLLELRRLRPVVETGRAAQP